MDDPTALYSLMLVNLAIILVLCVMPKSHTHTRRRNGRSLPLARG
jgi:hypothetical protein